MRTTLIALALAPLLLILLWGDTLKLYVGIAGSGAQAPYFRPPDAPAGPHRVSLVETRRIVSGPGMPADVAPGMANNNLDAVRHSDGRVYLAWRNAPDHFASPETRVIVASSADERDWRVEAVFSAGTDLREPRLLSLGERLVLYVSKLGKDRLDFEPKGVWSSQRGANGSWSELADAGLGGGILYRARVEQGRAYLVVYRGGENIYHFNGKPITIELLTTEDGKTFKGVGPADAPVLKGGGSEADFTFTPKGDLFAVVRNEAGDEHGWGSLLCTAPSGAVAEWSCSADPRKYDSPYVFSQGGEVYVVGRRNVTEDGRYAVGYGPHAFNSIQNQLAYISAGKRCALWRYGENPRRLDFVLDLPSRGDTCFPAVLPGSREDERVIYDYSSDIDGPDVAWSVGQRGPTYVYRHVLRFDPRG